MDKTQKNKDWSDYYRQTAHKAPSSLLVSATKFVKNKGLALELGAGSPKDSMFLLERGFNVIAVDNSPQSQPLFKGLENNNKFKFEPNSFENFDFEIDKYDLISAQRALPFIKEKETFLDVINKIKKSLRPGGIFVGHFFGVRDTWCVEGKKMTFITREETENLLKDVEIITLKEREEDSETVKGTPHHWHIFNIIFVKK